MAKIDLVKIGSLIILYEGLDKRACRLRIAALQGTMCAYLRQWLKKAGVILNDKQLCELELGILISSSVRRSPFAWHMFQKLITVMEWQEECQMKEEVMEEEDDKLSSVGTSAVWDTTDDESGNDKDVDFVRSASSASRHVNDPIVVDDVLQLYATSEKMHENLGHSHKSSFTMPNTSNITNLADLDRTLLLYRHLPKHANQLLKESAGLQTNTEYVKWHGEAEMMLAIYNWGKIRTLMAKAKARGGIESNDEDSEDTGSEQAHKHQDKSYSLHLQHRIVLVQIIPSHELEGMAITALGIGKFWHVGLHRFEEIRGEGRQIAFSWMVSIDECASLFQLTIEFIQLNTKKMNKWRDGLPGLLRIGKAAITWLHSSIEATSGYTADHVEKIIVVPPVIKVQIGMSSLQDEVF
ncbi:hypothetical protein JAAARDRAFT_51783 [Jaapia argillacea MUCL 33604]|uniref:Uncharacterized protein n=1 Tax=Jaapia argillacea MUCL 33604 TaxID=933084 RepID=A0A067PEA8_9AGAM|nr:hypothetical protein JAAARDRAFT_51783 [Jaapia argillacea MUCL 33604]